MTSNKFGIRIAASALALAVSYGAQAVTDEDIMNDHKTPGDIVSYGMGTQGQHLRFKLRHEGATWDAVAFGQADTWQDGWDTLGVDNWRGTKTFKLYVQDFRPTGDGLRAE